MGTHYVTERPHKAVRSQSANVCVMTSLLQLSIEIAQVGMKERDREKVDLIVFSPRVCKHARVRVCVCTVPQLCYLMHTHKCSEFIRNTPAHPADLHRHTMPQQSGSHPDY